MNRGSFCCSRGVNKKNNWHVSRIVRAIVLGAQCEVCGAVTPFLLGHHVRNKNRGGGGGHQRKHSWRNCQLRCRACEVNLHLCYSGGNNRKVRDIHQCNNEAIDYCQPLFAEVLSKLLVIQFFLSVCRSENQTPKKVCLTA